MLKQFLYITYLILIVYIIWLFPAEVKFHTKINLVQLKTIQLYVTAFIYGYVPMIIRKEDTNPALLNTTGIHVDKMIEAFFAD